MCKRNFDPQESTSFFYFRFCSDECENAAEDIARGKLQEVYVYICHLPFPIAIYDNTPTGKTCMVADGTKWRRDESQSRGLNAVHLENLSGRAGEKITWLEIGEDMLEKHFQRV
ncbi:hypothetical protein AAGS61_02880 [Lysinibacillus sp. KU-BSD001]|uniref:hypothetical protein n=1 Tax=Lysinibacillus sp. KU-BSD001 TaxID=3141328 RepID=UPI0036E45956